MPADPQPIEADYRFPSGKWVGFYVYRGHPEKHRMELLLTFRAGTFTGEGRDDIGDFTIDGTYDLTDGAVRFRKTYIARHTVFYAGFNEGKGIWGTWDLPPLKGGFHIWPEGMEDPTQMTLKEVAPLEFELPGEAVEELELVPAGA